LYSSRRAVSCPIRSVSVKLFWKVTFSTICPSLCFENMNRLLLSWHYSSRDCASSIARVLQRRSTTRRWGSTGSESRGEPPSSLRS
jgi:hypothetical protein